MLWTDMGTQTVSVACNNCGASLEIGESTRFVTCTYCGSSLEVHRTGAAAYTEVLHAIHKNTERIAEDVEVIKQQNELEALDREWMIQRESLMTTNKNGSRSVPSATGSLIGGGVMAVFGIVWTAMASSHDAPGFFPLFGIVFVAVAIGMAIYGFHQAGVYQQAEQAYLRRREEILRRQRP